MKIPSVPLVLSNFYKQETEKARNEGLPGLRIQWVLGPVWGKTREQLRRDVINGTNPIDGKPVMQELVDKFTKPLTPDETKTGEIIRDKGPATFTDTPENLQKLYMDNRWTDFLPIVLPTQAAVDEMLKGTSHRPDEIVGKMSPTNTGTYFEYWTFTVKDVAVNAVMAGCKPEYLPVLLAVSSTGKEAISVSDNSFVDAMVINGPIRDEIGINYDIGAMGPYAHANTTIGRAWSLIAINLGNCGKVGTTYMGTVGNPMNLINIVIGENEKESPWDPLSVRKGFKKNDNIVSLFEGWGVLSAKNWRANNWAKEMDFPKIIRDIFATQAPFLFGATAILSPPIAKFVKNAGYNTVDDFKKYLMAPLEGQNQPLFQMNAMEIIVAGGTNNNYYSIGGLNYLSSVQIDKWR